MDPEIKKHLTTGRELYQSGDYERARQHLEAVRDAHGDFADVHNMLGFIHYDQGRPREACAAFERALEINPAYTEAALNLSVVYNELGRYEEGRQLYERVHNSRGAGGLEQLEPLARGKIANMHRDLANAYTEVGLPEHAIKELYKALRVCPTFVDIRTQLAKTLRDIGRYEEALDEFEAVCDLSPHYIPARIHFGVTLWRVGRVEQARVQWREVMARDPTNRSCQVYLNMTAGESPDDVAPPDDEEAPPAQPDAAARDGGDPGHDETEVASEAAADDEPPSESESESEPESTDA